MGGPACRQAGASEAQTLMLAMLEDQIFQHVGKGAMLHGRRHSKQLLHFWRHAQVDSSGFALAHVGACFCAMSLQCTDCIRWTVAKRAPCRQEISLMSYPKRRSDRSL